MQPRFFQRTRAGARRGGRLAIGLARAKPKTRGNSRSAPIAFCPRPMTCANAKHLARAQRQRVETRRVSAQILRGLECGVRRYLALRAAGQPRHAMWSCAWRTPRREADQLTPPMAARTSLPKADGVGPGSTTRPTAALVPGRAAAVSAA